MKWLELKIPPVLVAFIFIVDMGFVQWLYPESSFAFPYHQFVGAAFIIGALIMARFAIKQFKAHQTTVNPLTPNAAQTLLTDGIFAYTRNPLYLALLIIIFGVCLILANTITLMHPILFCIYMHFFQIKPEERALMDIFGEDYLQYLTKTRRWI